MLLVMCLDRMLLLCTVIFGFWKDTYAVSPVPSVPNLVPALAGSCVVIPCSFTPPASHSILGRQGKVVGVRLRYSNSHIFFLQSTAFSSDDKSTVSKEFQGRTSLRGNTDDGDCSVMIDRVHLADSNVYQLALKGHGQKDWGKARSVNIVVSESPELPVISGVRAASEGQMVSLNCSISYSCPSRAPTLQWRWERGAQENSSEYGEPHVLRPQGQGPTLRTSLTFIASYRIKPRMRCEAVYPGGRRVYTVKELHVTFSPKDVTVQVHTLTVQEGLNVLLACSCKADPPVTEYRWSYTQHGLTVDLHQRTFTVRVYNVTRDMRVRCTAQNLIGRAESKSTSLNIQYKPAILHLSSYCVVERLEVLCRCSVDSNPRPAVTWSVNGSVPPYSYNTSVGSENGTLTATLKGHMETPLRVVCFAINALGNDSHTLLQAEDGSLLWKVIPAVCISLATFLLSLLLLFCCRKRSGKRVLTCRPPVYPGDMGIYQDRMPLYINCTEVTNIYTNGSYQLVYQNCTPLFVRTKQTHPMGRRGWERRGGERRGGERRRGERRGGERRGGESQGGTVDRGTRDRQSPASNDNNTETAIYLEII
ncbi:sialic acid-binding Ig-like lectin 5 isoform 1-T1 [Salvelinus alpinus]|uniref:sialic acid-binding Ig-like lectin 14 n=1 Tax=Salvelinus alpinus TaxID=8036 RepID=UPI0039FC6909